MGVRFSLNRFCHNYNKRFVSFALALILQGFFIGSAQAVPPTVSRPTILDSVEVGVSTQNGVVEVPIYDPASKSPDIPALVGTQMLNVLDQFGTDAVMFLVKTYSERGLTASRLKVLLTMAQTVGDLELVYRAHPNAQKGVEFINRFFEKSTWPMRVKLSPDERLQDPNLRRGGKWSYYGFFVLRFVVGPVVQVISAITGQNATSPPIVGATAGSVAAEVMFAVPYLDRNVFSPFFRAIKFGGLALFNTAYGIGVYECIHGLCRLYNIAPESLGQLSRSAAYVSAGILGLLFTSAYGRVQQDEQIRKETLRGGEDGRYIRTSSVGFAANGFRLASFFISIKVLETTILGAPMSFGMGEVGLVALGLFYALPNWVKTEFGPRTRAALVRAESQGSLSGFRGTCIRAAERLANWREFRIRGR